LVEPVPVVDCIVPRLVKVGESNALKAPSEVADNLPEEVNVKVPVTTGSDEVVPVTEDSNTLAPVDSMSDVMGSVPEDTNAPAPPVDSVSDVMGSVPEDTNAPAPPRIQTHQRRQWIATAMSWEVYLRILTHHCRWIA